MRIQGITRMSSNRLRVIQSIRVTCGLQLPGMDAECGFGRCHRQMMQMRNHQPPSTTDSALSL